MRTYEEQQQRCLELNRKISEERVKQKVLIQLPNSILKRIRGCKYCYLLEGNDGWKELGEGAYGKCYELSDKIVVKSLHKISDEQIVREISWLLNIWCIGHPNIVSPIFLSSDCVEIYVDRDGRPMITMQKVEGTSVSDTDFSTWTPFDKIWAFVQLVDCINLLHTFGLFHCDLHRMNVIMRPNKHPVIIDLGTMSTESSDEERDVMSLFDMLFGDMNLDEDDSLPLIFKQWGNYYNGDRSKLPNTVAEISYLLGEMSVGPLNTIVLGGERSVYPAALETGIMFTSFELPGGRYEEYSAKYFSSASNRQQNAINYFLANNNVAPTPFFPFASSVLYLN